MILTGLKRLDESPLGGIPNGLVTDIFGEGGTGKAHMLLQISINAVRGGGRVLHIDPTGSFRPERMLEMCGMPRDVSMLDEMTISRVTSASGQVSTVRGLSDDYSLVTIDSVTDLFSYEYRDPFERDELFMRHMQEISKFATTTGIPVVVTNTVRSFGNVEAMWHAIDPYTHVKIHLHRHAAADAGTPGGSGLSVQRYGVVRWALGSVGFPYVIGPSGLTDPPAPSGA